MDVAGIIKNIVDRVRMNAESLWSSVAETRMEVMAQRKRLIGKLRGAKPSAQESLLGFGIIPKPSILKSDELPPGLEADADASDAEIPSDGWGLVG